MSPPADPSALEPRKHGETPGRRKIELKAIDEGEPGPAWAAMAAAQWPLYRAWFLSQGEAARPTYLAGLRALRTHMPEMVPLYERVVALAGGSDLVARFLSGYCPPPYIAGCSQAVFRGRSPILVRNYDYSPELWDAVVLRTRWDGRTVVGMSDCLWGLLDGVNDAGLAVSLAFGGRRATGDGFGIPIILRYLLQTCERTAEAVALLCRVPTHMSYNITVLDAAGSHATVMVAPDRPPAVVKQAVVTNHQQRVEWHQHALATGSVDRLRMLNMHVRNPQETEPRFVRRFLEPPVYSDRHHAGIGTLYTAVYRPALRRVSYLWPRQRWDTGVWGPQDAGLTIDLEPGA